MNPRRAIPSVEKVLQTLGPVDLPRPFLVAAVREELGALRLRASAGVPTTDTILHRVRQTLERWRCRRLGPVINATGVMIHTNLGRAPLAVAALDRLTAVAGQYANLEFDLGTGRRGGRGQYLERALAILCGAPAATVVNNCAAALLLILRHFTAGERKEVLLSRGEMIQIGGGFRIPEIVEASGAALREVGTTNQTSLADYSRAISRRTALILKVHRSNFFMDGFVKSPSPPDLAGLARRRSLPLVEDLGSGAVIDTDRMGNLEHEPTPRGSLRAGAHLVCFSGDKLFGGAQAGIIVGASRQVRRLKEEPLFRALRCDKLTLAALEATADLYLEAPTDLSVPDGLPIVRMLTDSPERLRARAERILEEIRDVWPEACLGTGPSRLGGGALPRSAIPSVTVELTRSQREWDTGELAARLRQNSPPILGVNSGNRLRLDVRTVLPDQDPALIAGLRAAADVSTGTDPS